MALKTLSITASSRDVDRPWTMANMWIDLRFSNTERTVGTRLSHEIVTRYGEKRACRTTPL